MVRAVSTTFLGLEGCVDRGASTILPGFEGSVDRGISTTLPGEGLLGMWIVDVVA